MNVKSIIAMCIGFSWLGLGANAHASTTAYDTILKLYIGSSNEVRVKFQNERPPDDTVTGNICTEYNYFALDLDLLESDQDSMTSMIISAFHAGTAISVFYDVGVCTATGRTRIKEIRYSN